MADMTLRRAGLAGAAAALAATLPLSAVGAAIARDDHRAAHEVAGFRHLVVIYEENHSFDNLYGHWGRVGGQHVRGVADAPRSRTRQVDQDGTAYDCLLQVDPNLTSPPLPNRCQDPGHGIAASAFGNRPFLVDRFIKPTDTTCPPPDGKGPVANGGGLPGGCTADLVHRFYQEQYQLDGGRQDRYVTGSDAVGLTMGTYATRRLPIYRYLHRRGAPDYVVADRFFQAAFGGSYLNHQWLIAARTPLDTSGGASNAVNSVLDANGMVTAYPLYTPTGPVADGQLTHTCATDVDDYAAACGDFAVNTIQPASWPYRSGAQLPLIDDRRYPNIGDRLSDAGVSWAWYTGRWDEANATPGGTLPPLFQTHHQPFNYFADYAPGQPGRTHLRDEREFIAAARAGRLPTVSFVKPYGEENEHPGYASETSGSRHLVRLLRAIMNGPQARNTLVVVTYDEFGGQWDHVPPPGMGTRGVSDAWGPGTRIPALLVSARFTRSGVDHRVYDTTSILATIERSLRLAPLSTRDAAVADLRHAVRIGRP